MLYKSNNQHCVFRHTRRNLQTLYHVLHNGRVLYTDCVYTKRKSAALHNVHYATIQVALRCTLL